MIIPKVPGSPVERLPGGNRHGRGACSHPALGGNRQGPGGLGPRRGPATARANRRRTVERLVAGGQGHHRRPGNADPLQRGLSSGNAGPGTRRCGGAPAVSGRLRPVQDRYHQPGFSGSRSYPQSLEPRAHSRRLQQRLGGGRCLRNGPIGPGFPDSGFGQSSGQLLRGRGVQAHLRPAAGHGRLSLFPQRGYGGFFSRTEFPTWKKPPRLSWESPRQGNRDA